MADVSRFAANVLGADSVTGDVSRFAVNVLSIDTPVIPPDRDAGVWVEAWDIANTTRKIATVPVLTGGVDVQQLRRPPGGGSVTVPRDWGRLPEVFNPSDTVEPVVATGGTKTTPGDGYVYHQFTTSGTFTVTRGGIVDYLVVGGGAGGGAVSNSGTSGQTDGPGGGGGGGNVRKLTAVSLPAGSYPVTVGLGGAGGQGGTSDVSNLTGENGNPSSFNGLTAGGGGFGGGTLLNGTNGGDAPANGGGGGGAPGNGGVGGSAVTGGAGGDAAPGSGGAGFSSGGGGGGGPSGQAGADGDGTVGGNGGDGTFVPEFDQFGESGWFGGGGGGSIYGTTGATRPGGLGGGGDGAIAPSAGTANTGGGGGGKQSQQFTGGGDGGDGGSGVVIIRYPDSATAPTRSLVKVYDSGLFRYAFFPERINRPVTDANRPVTISGRGQESQVDWAPLPGPEWNYGYDTGYFQNFTDPPELLTNGGYTTPLEGSFNEPTPGWSARGGATHNPCTSCTTGSFGNVIRVNAAGVHTGIQQTVDVVGGRRYRYRTWIEGDVTGQRITITLGFNGAAASGATVHTSNTFVYPSGSDNVLAELENVARNPAGNGCPGGSTDGTVQYTEIDVTIPSGCNRLTVGIQFDTHPGCSQPANDTFYVHGASLEGIGAGMPDEFDYEPDVYSPTVWDTSHTPVLSGDYSWAWQPEDTALKRTLVGPIDAATGESFFAQYLARYPDLSGQARLVVYGNDATTIIADSGFESTTDIGFPRYVDVSFTGPASGQVYLGIIVQGTTSEWGIDEVAVFSGRPPASPGKIIGDMLTAVQADGFLSWLTVDFTDTNDSNGELWRSTSVAANFGYGGSLMQALDRIATMGYEWTIEAVNQRLGYDTGWVLRLFNGYGTTP